MTIFCGSCNGVKNVIAKVTLRLMVGRLVKNELERLWMEAGVV
jgi:hypothetical protein